MSRLIGVNTLVFNEELLEGKKKQWEYFKELKEMNFSFVEIRREFIRDLKAEFKETKEKASEYRIPLFYSVPSVLFESGQINSELNQYFQEAVEMGASQIKLTLGDYKGLSSEVVQTLEKILSKYSGVSLSIENDQSSAGGSAEKLSAFLSAAHGQRLPLKVTFDTGNFSFIQEIAEESAYILRDFVNYIHIKNVKRDEKGELALALFETGDVDIAKVLQAFPESIPAAIEYPCGDKETAMTVLEDQKKRIINQ